MVRIFSALAVVSLLLLGANFLVGLWIGNFQLAAREKIAAARRHETQRKDWDRILKDSHATEEEKRLAEAMRLQAMEESQSADLRFRGPRSRLSTHWFLGLLSSLMVVLVCSVTITYFVGTSRWCREVVETYSLHKELQQRSDRLKRRAFASALIAVFVVILIATLGALADPSAAFNNNRIDRSAFFVTWHYVAAIVGILLIACSYWIQHSRIAENHQVIEEILAEVAQEREKRGLTEREPVIA